MALGPQQLVPNTHPDRTAAPVDEIIPSNTGGLLPSKPLVVIPAQKLYEAARHGDRVEVNLTKTQLERFPVYDENA